jgi:hypothetical protein
MYRNNTVNKIGRIGLLLSLILGFMLISGTAVNAQSIRIYPQDRDNYSNNRSEMRRMARRDGYRAGLVEGASDARSGYRYNPSIDDNDRRGMYGYNSGYNNDRGWYRGAYREGYVDGYRDGYRRNSRRGFNIRLF